MSQRQQKPLQIQKDDKFFTRLLSKESSMANTSSRVLYYADRPGSVPFLWESQPGTPKTPTFRRHHYDNNEEDHEPYHHHFHVPPPLTPPPSFYSKHKLADRTAENGRLSDRHKRSRSSNLLSLLFPKRLNNIVGLNKMIKHRNKRSDHHHHRSCASMLDSATFCSGSTTTTSWFSSSSSSFDSREEEEEEGQYNEVGIDHDDDDSVVSPTSTLCFRCYRGC